jgi:hypothetical protein
MAQYGLSGLTNYDLKMLFLIVWIITLELIKLEGYVMGNTGRKTLVAPCCTLSAVTHAACKYFNSNINVVVRKNKLSACRH